MIQQRQQERVSAWKDKLRHDWYQTRRKAFQWLRNEPFTSISLLEKPDKTLTGNLMEIDELVQAAWRPIFSKYAENPEPSWPEFRSRFGQYIQTAPLELSPITGEQLAAAVKKQSKHTAMGADGWRATELKRLPPFLWNQLATVLNVVEATGRWPKTLLRAICCLIPKDKAGPLELRPLSIMSSIYRMWGSIRTQDLLIWQERWLHHNARGFRKNSGTEDLFWQLAVRVEKAILCGEELYGVSFDFRKCFDLIPHGILFSILQEMGLPSGILQPMRHMYNDLKRYWKLGKTAIGQPWQTTNGVLQGCGVSVVLLNCLVTLWLRAVSAEVPSSVPGGYADDVHATATTPAAVQKVVAITEEYAALSGQELNADKSFVFAVTLPQRTKLNNVKLGNKKLQVKSNIDMLGVSIAMDQAKTGASGKGTRADKRARKTKSRCQRLRYAPLDFECRETIAGVSALSPLVYGQAGKTFPLQVLASLRRSALQGIWHGAGNLSCAEVAFTLFLKGHRVDPVQALDFSCLVTLRRILSGHATCRQLAVQVWNAAADVNRRGSGVCGPVTLALAIVHSLGWRWNRFDSVCAHNRVQLQLFSYQQKIA